MVAGVAGGGRDADALAERRDARARRSCWSSKRSSIPTHRGRASRRRASSSRRSVAPMPDLRRTPATGRQRSAPGCAPTRGDADWPRPRRWWRWSCRRRATTRPFGGPQVDLPRIGTIAPGLKVGPLPDVTPSPSPSVSPSAQPSPTTSATPSASPSPSPTASPTASPSPAPTTVRVLHRHPRLSPLPRLTTA